MAAPPLKLHSSNDQDKSQRESQMIFDNSDIELLTKRQVADALKLSVSMINKLLASGELPYRRIGRSIRFVRSEIMAFLNRRKFP